MEYTVTYGGTAGDAYMASAIMGFLMVYYVVVIALAVLQIVGMWKVFTKSGEEGWKALIPFYNMYTLFELIYGKDDAIRFLMLLIPFYNIYLSFKYNIDLAHTYGKGTGFGVGLALVPSIFMPVLGLGKAKYVQQQSW